jgi:hypothetical protein
MEGIDFGASDSGERLASSPAKSLACHNKYTYAKGTEKFVFLLEI